MRRNFEPKHLQRAKVTLQKQLDVAKESKRTDTTADETTTSNSLMQRFKRFLKRLIS